MLRLFQVARTFYKVGRFADLEYIVKCAMSSAQFSGIKIYQRELDFLGVTACYCNGNLTAAFNVIRAVLLRHTGEKYRAYIMVHAILLH